MHGSCTIYCPLFPDGVLEFRCFFRWFTLSDLDHLLFVQTAAMIIGSLISALWLIEMGPWCHVFWWLDVWKSLRRHDASPAFRVLSGSVNEWVEVHWSNCCSRVGLWCLELLVYFQDLVGCIWERNIEAFPVFLNDSCVVWATRDIKKQIASCLECLDIWIGNPALPNLRFSCVSNSNPRCKHVSDCFLFFFSDLVFDIIYSIENKMKKPHLIYMFFWGSCSDFPLHSSWFTFKTGESYWTASTLAQMPMIPSRWKAREQHGNTTTSAWHTAIHIVIWFPHVVYTMCREIDLEWYIPSRL